MQGGFAECLPECVLGVGSDGAVLLDEREALLALAVLTRESTADVLACVDQVLQAALLLVVVARRRTTTIAPTEASTIVSHRYDVAEGIWAKDVGDWSPKLEKNQGGVGDLAAEGMKLEKSGRSRRFSGGGDREG